MLYLIDAGSILGILAERTVWNLNFRKRERELLFLRAVQIFFIKKFLFWWGEYLPPCDPPSYQNGFQIN